MTYLYVFQQEGFRKQVLSKYKACSLQVWGSGSSFESLSHQLASSASPLEQFGMLAAEILLAAYMHIHMHMQCAYLF
jgi:hypothetical protein